MIKNDKELSISFLTENYENMCNGNEDFAELKDILSEFGINIHMSNLQGSGFFSLTLNKDIYKSKKTRGAGRHYRKATKPDEEYDDLKITVNKSDVIYMMQSMKDKEIAKAIDMPIATYYRHKKRLTDSIAFQSLDPNRLQDKEYLEDNIYGAF